VNDERVDLSALDPSRDPERWDRMVRSVAARAVAARRRRNSVRGQLVAWTRPVLAAAASLALASWAGALASGRGRHEAPPPEQREEPAFVVAQWAASGQVPSTSRILEVLGGRHDAR
jgi:hypothetical protein